MNYIFVHLLNDMSGSPRVLSDLIDNFPKKGNKVLITNNDTGFLKAQNVDKFIRLPYVLNEKKYLKLLLYSLNQILSFFMVFYLILILKIKKQDSTVIINTLLPFGAALAAKLLSSKVIYYIHETYISPPRLNDLLTSMVYHTADQVIFVSNYVKSFHRKLSTKLDNNVVYNPLRSDFNNDEKYINKTRLFKDKYILYVGTLREYKGIYQFLSLAKMLPNKKFMAVINADKVDYNKFILENVIPDNLCFKRRPDNIGDIYSQALFTLNLSLPHLCVETFGLTLLESMHFSVPVIAPNYGGPKEIINDSVGFLIEPIDLDTIKNIILNVDEIEWDIMSRNSLEYSKRFNLEEYIKKISEII